MKSQGFTAICRLTSGALASKTKKAKANDMKRIPCASVIIENKNVIITYRKKPMSSPTTPSLIGRYIVADPEICHGKPTFRGTRVLVSDVLEQVASGMAWETIIEEWNNSVTKDAIQEAVQLASQAFIKHADEILLEPRST
jgi:uncharacterized protein (DUF433 family)